MKLKILLINNFTDLKNGGGPARYLLLLKKLLEKNGHKVATFSTNNSDGQEHYSTTGLDYSVIHSKNLFKKISAGWHSIHNKESAKKIRDIIDRFQPDIAHCHNIYNHLTPSILPELKKINIPVVMTLHDLKIACPNHRMFTQGSICERCKKHKYYNCFLHTCIMKSKKASLVGMFEAYFHYFKKYFSRYVDIFISPSNFHKHKFVEWGYNPNKFIALNNFIYAHESVDRAEKNRLLYFGMLSEVKGVGILNDALQFLKNDVKLIIAGNGPLTRESFINTKTNITFKGFLNDSDLNEEIGQSAATIFPSIMYENQPFSILETMSRGRPVIASKIGGIPELIQDGYNGLLFETGNSLKLAEKIDRLIDHPEETAIMGKNALKTVKDSFSPVEHYDTLMDIYGGLLKQ